MHKIAQVSDTFQRDALKEGILSSCYCSFRLCVGTRVWFAVNICDYDSVNRTCASGTQSDSSCFSMNV